MTTSPKENDLMNPQTMLRNIRRNRDDAENSVAILLDRVQSAVAAWTPDRVSGTGGTPANVVGMLTDLSTAVARRDALDECCMKLEALLGGEEACGRTVDDILIGRHTCVLARGHGGEDCQGEDGTRWEGHL